MYTTILPLPCLILLAFLALPVLSAPVTPRPAVTPPLTPGLKMIDVAGTKYVLRQATQVPGEVAISWTLLDDTLVAKQFRTHYPGNPTLAEAQVVAFTTELKHTREILGTAASNVVNGGESNISGTNDLEVSAWLVTPGLTKGYFKSQPWFKLMHGQGQRKCQAYLTKFVRAEFVRKMEEFYGRHGLVHLNANPSSTIWDSQAATIHGFINFGKVDKVNGPLYKQTVEELMEGVKDFNMSLRNLSEEMAKKYYPPSLCLIA